MPHKQIVLVCSIFNILPSTCVWRLALGGPVVSPQIIAFD